MSDACIECSVHHGQCRVVAVQTQFGLICTLTGAHNFYLYGPRPKWCGFKGPSVCQGGPSSQGQGPMQGPPYKPSYIHNSLLPPTPFTLCSAFCQCTQITLWLIPTLGHSCTYYPKITLSLCCIQQGVVYNIAAYYSLLHLPKNNPLFVQYMTKCSIQQCSILHLPFIYPHFLKLSGQLVKNVILLITNTSM